MEKPDIYTISGFNVKVETVNNYTILSRKLFKYAEILFGFKQIWLCKTAQILPFIKCKWM